MRIQLQCRPRGVRSWSILNTVPFPVGESKSELRERQHAVRYIDLSHLRWRHNGMLLDHEFRIVKPSLGWDQPIIVREPKRKTRVKAKARVKAKPVKRRKKRT